MSYRIIKFRVWVGERMWSDITGFECTNGIIEGVFIDGDYRNIARGEDGVELMQFTGLLDKNGKEIYEGDILSCTSEKVFLMTNKPTGEITTKIVTIGWQDEWSRFQLKKPDGAFELLPRTKTEWIAKWYEVIGNIYENPELMEAA